MKMSSVLCVMLLLTVSFSGMMQFGSQDAKAGYFGKETQSNTRQAFQETYSSLIAYQGGSIYVVGSTCSYGSGYYDVNTDDKHSDILIIKYDTNKNIQWARTYDNGDGTDDKGTAIWADNSGIYVAGTSTKYVGNPLSPLQYIVILKYDSEGDFCWNDAAKQGYETQSCYATSIIHDGNSIYVGGYATTSTQGINILFMECMDLNGYIPQYVFSLN